MTSIIIVADSDPRTQIVGGVGTYSAQLSGLLSQKYSVLFIGKMQSGKKIIKVPYDVLIANNKPEQNNIQFLISLCRVKKKIISSSNDIIHAQRPDWLWAFRNVSGKKIVTLHGSHSKNMNLKKGLLLRLLYEMLEKKGLNIADKIIAVDRKTSEEFTLKYPKLAHKIVCEPVGVDTKFFVSQNKRMVRKKLGIALGKKIFLFVGRLSIEKNIDVMINNLKSNEQLIIVGKGEDESRLKALSKNKDVLFVGPKNQSDLKEYYNSADALLLFSSHEGLPTVVLESFSCGVPVVATPVGELPFLIKEGKTGYIVANNDYRTAMDNILLTNEVMNRDCRKTALQYDWKNIAKKIEKEVYFS